MPESRDLKSRAPTVPGHSLATRTLFKPDLVVHHQVSTTVVDVAVCWEGHQPLSAAWQTKLQVYNHPKFVEAASQRWPGKPIIILPLIVGARGIWPRVNNQLEKTIGISNDLKRSIVNSTLKWGPSIHRHFMSTVWRKNRRNQHPNRRWK